MNVKSKYSKKIKQKIIQCFLLKKNNSIKQISEELNLSKYIVSKTINEHLTQLIINKKKDVKH